MTKWKLHITQEKFDKIVDRTLRQTGDITEIYTQSNPYFSEDIVNALSPITEYNVLHEKIEALTEQIEDTSANKRSFAITLWKVRKTKHAYDTQDFILKDRDAQLGIGEVTEWRYNPQYNSNRHISIGDIDMGKRRTNQTILHDKEANHSAFIAYLGRAIGHCMIYNKTQRLSSSKTDFVAWLFACEICRDLTERWFPVLEWFESLDTFRDFVNLNILSHGWKKYTACSLFTKDVLWEILWNKCFPNDRKDEGDESGNGLL